jgi:branched-chain amino acid transport system permease protein
MSDRRFVRSAARSGAIAGIVVLYVGLVGMVERVDALAIFGTVVLSWLLILAPPALAAYLALRPKVVAGQTVEPDRVSIVVSGVVAGVATAAPVAAFVGFTNWLGLDTVRSVLRSVSPVLMAILAFHTGTVRGTATLCALIVVAALGGVAFHILPSGWRKPIVNGLSTVLLLGLLQRIVPTSLDQINVQRDWFYSRVTLGLTDLGAVLTFLVAAGATFALRGRGIGRRPTPPHPAGEEEGHPLEGRLGRRRTVALIGWIAIAALLAVLPYLVGPVISRILGTVGIFLLLGLGLNIVVGYAGLLDLGYVAFFSVGAYFTAVLTGGQRNTFTGFQPPAFGAHLSFYLAIPIVVVAAALIGVLIGAPVLRLRGDYLAIVTLGFGEIARVIFGSTWAKGLFGGSAGMTAITKAPIGSFQFQDDPRHFYYLALAFCLLAIYVSWRLQDSRIGRAWNAMREDEQVANAMGINTVRYKLLAFAMGGAIGSIGGALFAVSIGSLTIATFQIIVSITALAIIILGGMGSIPGAILGAGVLIGLPLLLSEFEDYQLLIYGAVLVGIMLLRPQGLVPSVRRSRELQEEERAQDDWARQQLEGDPAAVVETMGGEPA